MFTVMQITCPSCEILASLQNTSKKSGLNKGWQLNWEIRNVLHILELTTVILLYLKKYYSDKFFLKLIRRET